MAENRIINKVVDYSNTYSQTLLDLTQDTVNRSNLERNQTAHDKEGEKITGALAIEDAEAWARGTRNGEPVTSEDETYHNNSKWYSTVSGSIMQIAGQMAQAAATSATSSSQAAVISGSYMNIAGQNAEEALDHAREAQSYARGDAVDDQGNPYRPGQDTDNAMYYKELAEEAAAQAGALDMTGATATTDGTHGLIKQPHAGDQDKPFHGDGTYKSVVADKVVLASVLNIGGQNQTEVEGSIDALNNTKQNNLTFDNTPTQNSDHPVKSDGIYTEIAKCIDYEMTTPSLSAGSVNITLYNPAITAEMKARPYADYSTSGAYADLTVNTYDGSVTLTGTVSAATTITFRLYTPTVISNIPQ